MGRKRHIAPQLAAAWARAAEVTEQEIASHVPSGIELQIAEALLSGAVSFGEIATHTGHHPGTISATLSDPVTAAWISHHISRHIQHRLGLIDAALYRAAVSGCVAAIRVFYERFDNLAPARTDHRHTYDFTKLSSDDLSRLLAVRLRALPGRDGRDSDPPRRAGDQAADRPVPLLPAPLPSGDLPQPPLVQASVGDPGGEQVR